MQKEIIRIVSRNLMNGTRHSIQIVVIRVSTLFENGVRSANMESEEYFIDISVWTIRTNCVSYFFLQM